MELLPAGNPKRETPLVLQAKFMLEKRRRKTVPDPRVVHVVAGGGKENSCVDFESQ